MQGLQAGVQQENGGQEEGHERASGKVADAITVGGTEKARKIRKQNIWIKWNVA
jgi:hypothetical protein